MRFPKEALSTLLKNADYKCQICGTPIGHSTASIDYNAKVSAGLPLKLGDCLVLCKRCNALKADRIIDGASASFGEPITRSSAKIWIHSFIRRPIFTSISTIVVFAFAGAAIYHRLSQSEQVKLGNKIATDQNFKAQIERLDATEESLQSLISFVAAQKEKLAQNELSIQTLESERRRLAPLLTMNRNTVDALFKAQEDRARKNADKERLVGFALGVLRESLGNRGLRAAEGRLMTAWPLVQLKSLHHDRPQLIAPLC